MEKNASFTLKFENCMNVFVAADNIISPLGFSSKVNFDNLKQMKTGVQFFENSSFSNEPVHAAIIDEATIEAEFQKLHTTENYTKLEKLAILSIQNALNENKAIDIISTKTLVVFSSTKGNIDLLDSKSAAKFDKKRLLLWETANVIARHFGNPNTPIIISNACISGVLALILAKRLLEENQYENINHEKLKNYLKNIEKFNEKYEYINEKVN